jgi:hypothetical protein
MNSKSLFIFLSYCTFYCYSLRASPKLPFTDLFSLRESNDFVQIGEETKEDLPELFLWYEKELGTFAKESCRQGISHVFYQHILTKKIYELYYTIIDDCDGGNSYGLILGEKKDSAHPDRVIGIIRDSSCSVLTREVFLSPGG